MKEISLENVSFSYNSHTPVLKNININFTNKKTAIIGQNGAGKTTLVKLLKKLLLPTEGHIRYKDIPYEDVTTAQLAKYIGLVFQNPNDQIFKNTVIDEVMFGPLNIGFTEEEAMNAAKNALEAVHLSSYGDKNPYDLSLAERKLIAIASVIAMDTDVIIFDEPTMGQDYQGKNLIKKVIDDLHNQGKLVLCILHDMDFTAEVFERVIVLNEGEVLADGSPKEVFVQKQILQRAHLDQPILMKLAEQIGLKENIITKEKIIKEMKDLV